VTPPILTGSRIATGVIIPVLPTWNFTSNNFVVLCSGGYLNAIAHLGNFVVSPNIFLNLYSLTLITAPSIAYSRFFLYLIAHLNM